MCVDVKNVPFAKRNQDFPKFTNQISLKMLLIVTKFNLKQINENSNTIQLYQKNIVTKKKINSKLSDKTFPKL